MLRPTSTGSDIVVDDMANIDQVFSDDDLVDVDALQAEVRALKAHVRTLMLEIAGSHDQLVENTWTSIDSLARLVMEISNRLTVVEMALHIPPPRNGEPAQPAAANPAGQPAGPANWDQEVVDPWLD